MAVALTKDLSTSGTISAEAALEAELTANGDELSGLESLLLLSALTTLVASVMTFIVF